MVSETIGGLEERLLELFPAADAESWDRTGLIAGDPAAQITGIAVALDPTVPAVQQAVKQGANVLVTHHPPFLHAPESFKPADSITREEGALVYEAIRQNVALMCFHTAFDNSVMALHILPDLLGLNFQRTVAPLDPADPAEPAGKGYGALCTMPDSAQGMSLGSLAALCQQVLGGRPRLWGDPAASVCSAITGQGSASSLLADALALNVDCLICGELKYHDALPASQAGLGVIELGHDISELPLAHKLFEVVEGLNLAPTCELSQTGNWTCL